MPEITTTVVAKSAYGIKVEQDGPWWNFSKVEFRGERFDTTVKKGDRVWIEYQEKEYGDEQEIKFFISQIAKVTSLGGPVQEGAQKMQQAARETNAAGEPFPAVDEFLPDDNFGPEGQPSFASDASESPEVVYGQEIWAKDKLRARTDCIACATGIFKSCLESGILKEFPSASAVVAYATELEKWAKDD
jgi:hypothetical protein